MELTLAVEQRPLPQKRHSYVRIWKKVRVYDPSGEDKLKFRDKILLSLKEKELEVPLDKDVSLELQFYFRTPKKSSSGRKLKEINANGCRCTKKPDVDNLAKFIMDACNGVLWKDDAQVYKLTAEKFYGNIEGTLIKVNYVDRISPMI